MAGEHITSVTGTACPLPGDDVDTDRIIPARFLRCVTFDGLGEQLFWDERFDEHARPKPHPLNDPRYAGASVLIVGRNFGCGSSREHAPQSIRRAGFRALVGVSFAEIFAGNSLALGVPCVTVPEEVADRFVRAVQADPAATVTVDVAARTVTVGGDTVPCGLPDSTRDALLHGRWDPLAGLLDGADAVRAVRDALPYTGWGAPA